MQPYVAKKTLQMLRQGDYPGLCSGPYTGKRRVRVREGNATVEADVRGRETGRCCERQDTGRLLRRRKKPRAKRCRWFSEAGKVQEVNFPLAPSVGTQSCSYLDFRTLTSVTVK